MTRLPMLALLLLGPFAHAQCGAERWPVKTLTDTRASCVHVNVVVRSTVRELRALKAPVRPTLRTDQECQVYSIPALIVAVKSEADNDLHVVIADPTDPKLTMVVEIPAPACAAAKYRARFQTERRTVSSLVKLHKGKLTRLSRPRAAQITGVLFFDKVHGQSGVAPNGVELHPVIGLEEK